MPLDTLTAAQIKQLGEQMSLQKQTLLAQLQQSEASSQPVQLDQQSVGRVSRVDAIQQQQMAVANRQQSKTLLMQIDASLHRIDEGEYGLCLHCGENIGLARLQVQPHTPNCLACQSELESR